ncbi:AraC family transcriptional regulator [Chitinophaga silvisoli]|uniref:AraC family transcriptional regulator n=2 Tax=Chitinophaga silvisoli TaxID=2291814 RepID=A0A3E1P224_9BACT|nr:AraC family transcriptional regulator [Chitinophaga silvisoli]
MNAMSKNIPTYPLNILKQDAADQLDFLFVHQKIETPQVPIDLPYRSSYYGVGICVQGEALLHANLESYKIQSGCVVTMSPHVIKQWHYMSADFTTLTIFFTDLFLAGNEQFPFFERVANHVFAVSAAEAKGIIASLKFIQQKYEKAAGFRNEILQSLAKVLLYEMTVLYNQQSFVVNTPGRSQLLSADFKKLVQQYFYTERSVRFYAEKLFVSRKHLSETVKEITGKTAGEWIDATVVLEAKVLLLNPTYSIAQIADMLYFSDQSRFGRYFKNLTGLSPLEYRQTS